jgi:hypothetical protein
MKFWCITYKVKLILPFLFLLLALRAPAQNGTFSNTNSGNTSGSSDLKSLTDSQIMYIKNSYSEIVEAPKELINGKEYESYYARSEFKPLLFINKKRTGTIFTHTRQYNNLTLQYDTFLDEVIYTDATRTINYSFPQIALNKDILDGFNLYFDDDSLIFKYFRLPECSKVNLKEGFYEVAYFGKSKYVIRHTSSFYVRDGLNEYKYDPENYISTGDSFFKIKNKRNFLKMFGAKSDEIKRYIHMSKIRIRQADKEQYVSILKFYDSLMTSTR